MVLPAGRVNPPPLPLTVTVPPTCGVTFLSSVVGLALLPLASAITADFSAGVIVGVTGASLLLRKFNCVAKAATGCRACFSRAHIVDEALLPPDIGELVTAISVDSKGCAV